MWTIEIPLNSYVISLNYINFIFDVIFDPYNTNIKFNTYDVQFRLSSSKKWRVHKSVNRAVGERKELYYLILRRLKGHPR